MAEALRGKFTGIDLDEVVDWPVVRTWLYWGMFWLIVTPSVGVALSSYSTFPTISDQPAAHLRPSPAGPCQRRHLRRLFDPVHRRMLLPGSAPVRGAGGVGKMGRPLAWVWNLALLAGLISLPLGDNDGLEAGELPLYAEIPLFIVVAAATAQFLVTIARRLETPLYVALWYLIATFVWTTMNLVLGTFILPYTIAGINSAAFHGLYIHYIVGLWITPAGYVLIYYFLPVSLRNPLFAHKLSLVGFWSLAVFYPFVGIHHYLFSPIADWAETIAIITSMLLIIPVWTVLVNFFGTMIGQWHEFRMESAGEVPDHGLADVPGRLLPGLDRGAALDPAADPLHRLRHLALAPDRLRHVRGLGDRRPGLCLAAHIQRESGRSRWATGRSG